MSQGYMPQIYEIISNKQIFSQFFCATRGLKRYKNSEPRGEPAGILFMMRIVNY